MTDYADLIEALRLNGGATGYVDFFRAADTIEALLAENERLRQRATCGCGDGFTEHDPGTCGNCLAGMCKPASEEREACEIAVWLVRQEATKPDASEHGVNGWLQEAEDAIRMRNFRRVPA